MFLRSIFTAWLAIFAFPQADPPRSIEVRVWVNAVAKNGLDAEIVQHTVEMLERLPNVTIADRVPLPLRVADRRVERIGQRSVGGCCVADIRQFKHSR